MLKQDLTNKTEEQLVNLANSGKINAIKELLSKYFNPIYDISLAFTYSKNEAKDILCKILFNVIKTLNRKNAQKTFSAFLMSRIVYEIDSYQNTLTKQDIENKIKLINKLQDENLINFKRMLFEANSSFNKLQKEALLYKLFFNLNVNDISQILQEDEINVKKSLYQATQFFKSNNSKENYDQIIERLKNNFNSITFEFKKDYEIEKNNIFEYANIFAPFEKNEINCTKLSYNRTFRRIPIIVSCTVFLLIILGITLLFVNHSQDNNINPTIVADNLSRPYSNSFHLTSNRMNSSFSLNFDRSSFLTVKRYIKQNRTPPQDAVFISSLLNNFQFSTASTLEMPFTITDELIVCPWNKQHYLLYVMISRPQTFQNDFIFNNLDASISFNKNKVQAYRLLDRESSLFSTDEPLKLPKTNEFHAGSDRIIIYEIIPTNGKLDVKTLQEKVIPENKEEQINSFARITITYQIPNKTSLNSMLDKAYTKDLNTILTNSPSKDATLAASIVQFGLMLQNSKLKGTASLDNAIVLLNSLAPLTEQEEELLDLMQKAKNL